MMPRSKLRTPARRAAGRELCHAVQINPQNADAHRNLGFGLPPGLPGGAGSVFQAMRNVPVRDATGHVRPDHIAA